MISKLKQDLVMYAGFDHRTTEVDRRSVQAVHDALQSSVAGSICSGTDIPYVLSSMWTNKTNPSTTSDPRGGERNTTGSVMVLLTPSNKDWLKRSMQKIFFAQDVPTSRSCCISLPRDGGSKEGKRDGLSLGRD